MMHGIRRSRAEDVERETDEQKRRKADKERAKIEEYRAVLAQLKHKDDAGEFDDELLGLTSKALSINPEYTTGWNVRRRTLLHTVLANADDDVKQQALEQDLQLTNASLRYNPKNYNVWEHRKWVLETMPDADWSTELKLVEAFLEKDARNFHSWDYRRYCVQSIEAITNGKGKGKAKASGGERKKPLPTITTASELAYTKRKIAENFSNFSAWHYRSKLLPRLWEERQWPAGSSERTKHIDEEFELVRQAIWSDPNDQSVWLYHRWLVGDGSVDIVRREIADIRELLDEEPDSRWCLESLHYYQSLLATNLARETTPTGQKEIDELNAANLELLDKLAQVDPLRKNRYNDMRRHIVPYHR